MNPIHQNTEIDLQAIDHSMEYLADLYRISGEDMLSLISANSNVRMK